MKFARYLEETLVPEWKRAYIDYRGLKKRITAIKEQLAAQKQAAREANRTSISEANSTPLPFSPYRNRRKAAQGEQQQHPETSPTTEVSPVLARGQTYSGTLRTPQPQQDQVTSTPARRTPGGGYGSFALTPPLTGGSRNLYRESGDAPNSPPEMTLPPPIKSISDLRINALPGEDEQAKKTAVTTASPNQARILRTRTNSESALSPRNQRSSVRADNSPVTPRRPRLLSTFSNVRKRSNSAAVSVPVPTTLHEVLETMTPLQVQFVQALDMELAKVQNFYREREKDALVRSALIKEQLNDLKDHRRIFHAYEEQQSGFIVPKAIGKLAAHLSPSRMPWALGHKDDHDDTVGPGPTQSTSRPGVSRQGSPQPRFDPDEYQNAKKKLKKAVLEFYRGIEYLHNYRILNLTGFRKALKKFEKATQIRVSQLYHNERIEPSILSNPKPIDDMLENVEALYAARFEGGDKKKAKSRLRASFKQRSHHYSTFRTGMCIGLSIPAIAAGIYEACQPSTQERIPAWSSLLQIYLAFFIPVVFGLFVSLNIIVWAHVRINYIFIFELDVRTVVDSREYAELPAFLLMTLAYAFWFSFCGLDLKLGPTAWPMAWLVLAALILINPFPVFYPHSRRWILRKSGRLFMSGTRRVEFQDFFLGDQYCSMVYTLTNIYFMGCLYKSNFTMPWGKCELPLWEFPWLLASIPSFIRLVQCVRRYADSGQHLHLVNGGKYGSSILYYALYYNWRNAGSPYDKNFIAWVIFACVMSCYTTSWDFLMDWSLFQRDSKYRFLRKELIYTNHIWVYYFAIITNILIRFGWVFYIPVPGPHPNVRGGILGVAEALRRFQWNFFRLENEHLGNADQYRVTREVPLPYAVDPADLSEDGGDEDDQVRSRLSQKSPLRLSTLRKSPRDRRVTSE
ncbi:hypothetical protein M408DRAFT_18233 [Serendipita vermifera MAFF 305830]|uniref:SPX domain-containing protein n=1 Tax=Serendipita vermifera MAFF 305830 TaxID=933852 RepID=A0A0C3ASA3_SERVB|nr:hypothetical protein M408DRAFT_18233 [Serendipita vermifera MAFF 305830]